MDWKELDAQLDELRELLNLPVFEGIILGTLEELIRGEKTVCWSDFWGHAKDVQAAFKSVRYPTQAAQQAAWARFNELRDAAMAISKRDREEKLLTSKGCRDSIRDLAKSATYNAVADDLIPPRLNVDGMREMGRLLSDGWRKLSECKEEMLAEHKRECFDLLTEAKETQDGWWARYKEHREEKHNSWRDRVGANLEKNRDILAEKCSKLARMEEHAGDLREKIDNAWNEDFREKAQGWLAELEEKIDHLKERIAQLEGYIEEDEEKLAKR